MLHDTINRTAHDRAIAMSEAVAHSTAQSALCRSRTAAPNIAHFKDAARQRYEAMAGDGICARAWVSWKMLTWDPETDPEVPEDIRREFWRDRQW